MPRPPTSPSPPPASFPYTIGSFDFPHASTSPSSSHHTGSATTSRNALLSLADRALEQTSFTEHDALTMPRHTARRTRVASRGPLHRVFGPPRDSDVTDHLSRRPPTANPNRPRATPSERYLRRSQTRRRRQPSAENDPATRLLESLSGLPTNNPFTLPDSNARARSPVVQVNSERRNKRRKLDHDTDGTPEYTCYKYGHKGQVVPGRLRMEVVSCDGGEHRKDNSPGQYRVQNVLRNDKSVYCSESSQCNLLLKHMGEASFALEKIVIRAPDRGFTAPVQEGLIFVSMSKEELQSGTSAYNLQYGARSPSRSTTPSSASEDDEQLSFREALEDPLVWQHSHQGTQDVLEQRTADLRPDSERRRILRQMVEHEDEGDDENCDHTADHSYIGAAGISAPTPPPFTISTVSEEEESDSDEELPNPAIMADRLRRESRWRPNSGDEENGVAPRPGSLRRAPPLNNFIYNELRELRERNTDSVRASRVAAPSRMEPEPALSNEKLVPPHARFFIAKNKNKITIKFHPAISGKYVLVKFWSPKHDGDIDIESVQFYGYSGPRFFPATQLR